MGGTPLYRHVPPQKVWVLHRFGLKTYFWSEFAYGFRGNLGVHGFRGNLGVHGVHEGNMRARNRFKEIVLLPFSPKK